MKKQNNAQIISEYSLLIAVIITAMVSMSLFVRRALHGRIKDAKDAMMEIVRTEYDGTLNAEYEPYYLEMNSTVGRAVSETTRHADAGGFEPVYTKEYDNETTVVTKSKQAPPRDAD